MGEAARRATGASVTVTSSPSVLRGYLSMVRRRTSYVLCIQVYACTYLGHYELNALNTLGRLGIPVACTQVHRCPHRSWLLDKSDVNVACLNARLIFSEIKKLLVTGRRVLAAGGRRTVCGLVQHWGGGFAGKMWVLPFPGNRSKRVRNIGGPWRLSSAAGRRWPKNRVTSDEPTRTRRKYGKVRKTSGPVGTEVPTK